MKNEIVASYSFLKYLVFKYKLILIIIISVFLLGFFLGIVAPSEFKLEVFKNILGKFSTFSSQKPTLFYEIFWNNLVVSFINFLAGFLIVVPLLIILSNGLILGVVVDFIFRVSAINTFYNPGLVLLSSLLPHGVVEIPLVLLSAFLPTLVGLKMLFKIEPDLTRRSFLLKILKVYLFVIIPFLLIAAFIESFLTSAVSERVATSTINKQKMDTTLTNVILQSEDIKKLNLEVSLEKTNDLETQVSRDWIVRQITLFVYNNEIYSVLKQVRPENSLYKFYKLNNGSTFIIQLSRFKEEKNVKEEIELLRKIMSLLPSKYQDVSVSRLQDDLFKINLSNKSLYLKFAKVKKYVYSVTYEGDNLKFFGQLVKLQAEKLEGFNAPILF